MHMVVGNLVCSDRLKSARAYVKGNKSNLYALIFELLQHKLIKMQTRRRCSNGTLLLTINSLVTLAVAGSILAIYIGW